MPLPVITSLPDLPFEEWAGRLAQTRRWPISADTPATGQNDKLMDYAGKTVSVTGKVYTKGGSRAIVIEKVAAADHSK